MQKISRQTKQRMVILEALRSVYTHPTADELYLMAREHLPKISLGTVYRNLDVLVRQGDIICIESGGGQRRFDGNPEPHWHIRCEICGCVADIIPTVALPDVSDIHVEGFSVTSARLDFDGICSACQAKKQ